MLGFGKHEMPEKPESHDDQMDMVWIAIFNHMPTQLGWLNTKMTFLLSFMGVLVALTSLALALLIMQSL